MGWTEGLGRQGGQRLPTRPRTHCCCASAPSFPAAFGKREEVSTGGGSGLLAGELCPTPGPGGLSGFLVEPSWAGLGHVFWEVGDPLQSPQPRFSHLPVSKAPCGDPMK